MSDNSAPVEILYFHGINYLYNHLVMYASVLFINNDPYDHS